MPESSKSQGRKTLPHLGGGGFKYLLFSRLLREMKHFDERMFQMGWFKPPSSHEIQIITSFHDFVRTPRVRNRLMTKYHSVHFFCHTKCLPLVGWNSFKDLTTLFNCWIVLWLHFYESLCTQAASMKFSCLHWQKPLEEVTEVTRPCLDREWRKTCDLADSVEGGWMESENFSILGGDQTWCLPWLFRFYSGWNPTQLYGDYFISHYKDPS